MVVCEVVCMGLWMGGAHIIGGVPVVEDLVLAEQRKLLRDHFRPGWHGHHAQLKPPRLPLRLLLVRLPVYMLMFSAPSATSNKAWRAHPYFPMQQASRL